MNDAQTAHAAVVEAAKKLVRAWAQHVYTIQTYGEGEAEVLRPIVQQEEEGLQTAVGDLLAAETQFLVITGEIATLREQGAQP